MAKVLETYDFASHRLGRYPWHEWSDGRIWKVTEGVDFKCEPASFRSSLYGHAFRHHLKVALTRDGDAMIFQFSKNGRNGT